MHHFNFRRSSSDQNQVSPNILEEKIFKEDKGDNPFPGIRLHKSDKITLSNPYISDDDSSTITPPKDKLRIVKKSPINFVLNNNLKKSKSVDMLSEKYNHKSSSSPPNGTSDSSETITIKKFEVPNEDHIFNSTEKELREIVFSLIDQNNNLEKEKTFWKEKYYQQQEVNKEQSQVLEEWKSRYLESLFGSHDSSYREQEILKLENLKQSSLKSEEESDSKDYNNVNYSLLDSNTNEELTDEKSSFISTVVGSHDSLNNALNNAVIKTTVQSKSPEYQKPKTEDPSKSLPRSVSMGTFLPYMTNTPRKPKKKEKKFSNKTGTIILTDKNYHGDFIKEIAPTWEQKDTKIEMSSSTKSKSTTFKKYMEDYHWELDNYLTQRKERKRRIEEYLNINGSKLSNTEKTAILQKHKDTETILLNQRRVR